MRERRILIRSSFDEVPSVGAEVRDAAAAAGIAEGEAAMLELGVVEALNNVIEHAYAGAAGPIEIVVVVTDAGLTVNITDRGTAADGARMNSPPREVDASADRADLEEGGRGLEIIHAVFDIVEYETNASGNRWRLTKRIRP